MSEQRMNTTQLAAHLFCMTQTEEKLQREGVKGKAQAKHIQRVVERTVRQAIEEMQHE